MQITPAAHQNTALKVEYEHSKLRREIRKKLSSLTLSKPLFSRDHDRTPALYVVDHKVTETLPPTYSVTRELTDSSKPSLPKIRTQEKIDSITQSIECLLYDQSLVTLAVTMNVAPSTEDRLRAGCSLNDIRDQFRKAIKPTLSGSPIYFTLVMEKKKGRPHFHGALAVPRSIFSEDLIEELTTSLHQSSLCRKYHEVADNKAVVIKSHYVRKSDPAGTPPKPVDSNWIEYITKNVTSRTPFVISTELRAKKNWSKR